MTENKGKKCDKVCVNQGNECLWINCITCTDDMKTEIAEYHYSQSTPSDFIRMEIVTFLQEWIADPDTSLINLVDMYLNLTEQCTPELESVRMRSALQFIKDNAPAVGPFRDEE